MSGESAPGGNLLARRAAEMLAGRGTMLDGKLSAPVQMNINGEAVEPRSGSARTGQCRRSGTGATWAC